MIHELRSFPVKSFATSILLTAGFLFVGCDSASEAIVDSHHSNAADELRWVFPDADGNLVYETDERGNRIPDFSNAGYMGGGVAIPDVPTRLMLEPADGDDTARIQAAVDELTTLEPDANGFRGALLLKRGTYQVEGVIRIAASGIVLRGEGQDEDGTIILATGTTKRDVIVVAGEGRPREIPGSRRRITDDYVPVGARSFQIENTDGYAVGDRVAVLRPSTAEWISAIGMNQIPPRADGGRVTQWTAGSRDFTYDRVIAAIDGNEVTLNAPIFNALDQEFGGGFLYQYTFPGQISQIGIEHLRGVSEFAGKPEDNDEDHGWTFITLGALENAWVRNITSYHFGFGLAYVGRNANRVTIQDSICLEPVSIIRGSRRYPFYLSGQFGLVQRCYASDARHDFAINSAIPGPNVFLDCFAERSHSDTGPHHRWATGALFDNVRVPNHSIRVINRLNYGSGHGWAGANMVIWNSEAGAIIMQNPPTAQNWAIGNIGERSRPPFPGDQAYFVSHGKPVEPKSLYLAQLRERLGDEAIENIAQMDIRAPIQIRDELWK